MLRHNICPFSAGKDETKIIRMLVKDAKTDDYTQVAKLDDFGASEYDIRTQQKFQYLEQMLIQEGVIQPSESLIRFVGSYAYQGCCYSRYGNHHFPTVFTIYATWRQACRFHLNTLPSS